SALDSFFFQAEDGIRDFHVTGVQTCALPILHRHYIAMVSPAMYCATGIPPRGSLVLRAYPSPQSRVLTRLDRRQCEIAFLPYAEIGRASCRERGEAAVAAGALHTEKPGRARR